MSTRSKCFLSGVASFAVGTLFAQLAEPVDAHSYVQRGLVMQLDAIDNVGTGVHDPTAKTWKCLVTGKEVALSDDDNWVDGTYLNVLGSHRLEGVFGSQPGKLTLEAVARPTGAYPSEQKSYTILAAANRSSLAFDTRNQGFHVTYKANMDTTSTTLYYRWIETPWGAFSGILGATHPMTYDAYFTTVQPTPNYNTLALGATVSSWESASAYEDVVKFGYSVRTIGEYSLRVYNVELTPEERRHNADVDHARFGTYGWHVPAGETVALENLPSFVHQLMTIDGHAVLTSTNVNPKIVHMRGGTVTVDAKQKYFGLGSDGNTQMFIDADLEGRYGKIVVTNGTAGTFGGTWGTDFMNVGVRKLRIVPSQVPAMTHDGCIDVFDLHGGSIQSYWTYNESSYTARIDVVGANYWGKFNGWEEGVGSFRKGRFLIDLHSGASLTYYCSNQRGSFNDEGVVVRTVGAGKLTLQNRDVGSASGALIVRNGACFDHDGELVFDTHSARIDGNNVIGPHLRKISASSANGMLVRINGTGVTLNVPDVNFYTTGTSVLVGNGTVNIDCATAPHTFVANSPETYTIPGNTKATANALTVSKTGAYEAMVTSKNLIKVWVREGVMRFMGENCSVADLTAEEDAEAVVDGVALTLTADGKTLTHPAISTVNGGRIVYAGAGTAYLCEPRITGSLCVTSGSLVPTAAAGEKRDGLSSVGPVEVQVGAGATLDLSAYTEISQVIDGLTVSTAAANGTIKGGELAAAGTIAVDAFDYENPPDPIELVFEDVAGLDRLGNWKVVCNGVPLMGVAASYDIETKKLKLESSASYLHITEAGAGDLAPYLAEKDLVIKIDAGVFYTNTAALVGSNGLSVDASGTGRLVFSQRSDDYSGTIALNSGTLSGMVTNAFGKGTVQIAGSTTEPCRLILGSSVQATRYENDFVLRGDSSSSYPAIYLVTERQKSIVIAGDITAYGDLYIRDAGSENGQLYNVVFFSGAVKADGCRIDYPCDNKVSWNGTVVSRDFCCLATWPRMGRHYFRSSENRIGKISVIYNSVEADGDDAFGGAAFDMLGGTADGPDRGSIFLGGHDVTLAYLSGLPTATWDRNVDYDKTTQGSFTLTGGVASATASLSLGMLGSWSGGRGYGYFSIVVDAGNDDFVQVLTNSVGSTFGTVAVRNGTLRFAGASSLANTPSLTVSGGRLELETTKANAFAKVSDITVGANAVLRVGPRADTPFGNGKKTSLTLDKTGVIELPEGAAVTVGKVTWSDGSRLSLGDYTGAEGADGIRKVLSQIRGAGTLTVLRGGGLVFIVR